MWQSNRVVNPRVWESIRNRLHGDEILSNADLDSILAQILTLSMPITRLRTEEVGSTLVALAKILPLKSELLVSDFTSVVKHCCKEKLLLTKDQLSVLIPFLIAALTQCASWYTEQILTTLSLVLSDNAENASPFHDAIFAAVTHIMDPTASDVGARYAATNCMANIVGVIQSMPPFGQSLWRIVLDNFVQQTRQLHNDTPQMVWTTNRTHYKMCISSMQCLLPIMLLQNEETQLITNTDFQRLLLCLRQILGCGLIFSPHSVGRHSLSDSDSDNSMKRGIGLAARLRLIVLRLLTSVVQLTPTTCTNNLGNYIADTSSMYMLLYDKNPSLLTLVLCDPYDQVRLAALKWLEIVWGHINLRAVLSQNFKSSTAFTSTGTATLMMVYQTFLVLLHNLYHEPDSNVIVQTFKTTTSLISACPINNMIVSYTNRGLIPSFEAIVQGLASQLHFALFASEHTVRVGALASISVLLSTSDMIPCLLTWLPSTKNPMSTSLCNLYTLNVTPLIRPRPRSFLEDMLTLAKSSRESTSLHRLDAMSLLSKTAKNYAPSLSVFWTRLSEFLLVAFRDVDQNVRLQAVKILENYVKGETKTNHHLDFMMNHLIRAFQDPSHHVRASVCACFTLLRPSDWDQFKSDNYLKYFLATPRDNSPVVRAAGFRLLGALALIPLFKTPEFISHVVSTGMELSKDPTLNVRVRVVWAIGNACTTPGPESEEDINSPWLIRLLSPELIDRVLECMLSMVDDNDKVASSVVRTMGLLTRWLIAPAYLEKKNGNSQQANELLSTSMTILAKKVLDGAPKVRWNACHAMAKVFHCPTLPLASATWTPSVFRALTAAIAQQDNFKVRISAAMALRISCARISYGLFYEGILQTILDALDSAVELADISEYKYKAQLELQLSFTLVHLIALANLEDEKMIGNLLCKKYKDFIYDWLYHQQHKMYAAIFGDDRNEEVEEGHEVNPVSCAQVVDACNVLLRVIPMYCPHTPSCVAQIEDIKLIFEMDILDTKGFEF